MNKQILIPYEEYLDLVKDVESYKGLIEDLESCTSIECVETYEMIKRHKRILVLDIDQLKQVLKYFYKVDEVIQKD